MKTIDEVLSELNAINNGWSFIYDLTKYSKSNGKPESSAYFFSNNYLKMTYYYDGRYQAENGKVRYNDNRAIEGDFQKTAQEAYDSLKSSMTDYAQNILNLVSKM